ncbi:aldehyde dehydrogenase family protein [Streptomyces diastatochromogenes]|nr:aldehyde dehydrogenase family protein [Streptomyces diastatochromogenes]
MRSGVIEAGPGTTIPDGSTDRPASPTGQLPATAETTVPGIVDALLRNQDALHSVLTRVATAEAATDELFRSMRALSGAPWELLRNSPARLGRLATFLPSNNLLYSYVLFGVIPSLYTDEVRIRPSARVAPAAMAVHEILGPQLRGLGGGRIIMAPSSQREFLADCARSDAVVFTGQPDNGEAVAAHLPADALLLTFGSGPNPLVVGPEADPETVTRTVLDARLYNSGQDCLCTDIVLVHRSLAHEVVPRLADALSGVRVGDRRDPGTRVAPLVYPTPWRTRPDSSRRTASSPSGAAASTWRGTSSNRPCCTCPGRRPSTRRSSSPPSCASWSTTTPGRSPAGCTPRGDRPRHVRPGLREPALAGAARIATSVVCHERITFDAEDGNRPFGGYGLRAGSVRRRGTATGRPCCCPPRPVAGQAREGRPGRPRRPGRSAGDPPPRPPPAPAASSPNPRPRTRSARPSPPSTAPTGRPAPCRWSSPPPTTACAPPTRSPPTATTPRDGCAPRTPSPSKPPASSSGSPP